MAAYRQVYDTSPVGCLPRTGISSDTIRSVIEYRLPLPCFVDNEPALSTTYSVCSLIIHYCSIAGIITSVENYLTQGRIGRRSKTDPPYSLSGANVHTLFIGVDFSGLRESASSKRNRDSFSHFAGPIGV